MQITFLGTGTSQGVPVIGCNCDVCRSTDEKDKRLRSALLIEINKKKLVIDCGPDFRQQMLKENISSIDAILITHGHKDHIGGLDDVRAFNYFLKRPTDVYADKNTIISIRNEFSYAFQEKPYPGVPEINLIPFRNERFFVNSIGILPVKAFHFNQSQSVFGFRINDLTYLTDAVHLPESEKEKMIGTKVLIINALRKEKHYSHFNLEQALAIIGEIKPRYGYITHISHQMGKYHDVNPNLPHDVQLAYDGLRVDL